MEDIRIYVASLSDYNDGRLEGKWFDFSDYSDASELMEAIQEMLDELTEKYKSVDGEVREEWAVHDYEGIPSTLASEYMGEQDFQQIYDIAEVAEESNVPLEVLIERAGDTGSDDYKALAESLMFVVDGSNEGDIVMEWEDQIGELGSDFWSNHIYIDDVTERVIYGEDVDRFRDDILSENPDMDEDEAEAEAERMADAEAEMREDLPSYLDEMGYGDTIPDFVSKDYEGAWERSMRYDYDVIYHDGQMYVFSNNYSVGGTILSGMIGAYIGYKVGRARPQKKGFSTEKKIGRNIKGALSKKKMERGGKFNQSWSQDHYRHNKGESYEVPVSKRKNKYAVGGGVSGKKYYWIKMDRNKIDEYINYASRMRGMFEGEIYTQAPNKVAFETEDDMFHFTSMLENDDMEYQELFNGEPRENIFDKITSDKYAKGGMTEHGLKVGDEIMGYTKDVNELHVVNRKNNDEWHSVDLDDGKRYAGGGGVSEFWTEINESTLYDRLPYDMRDVNEDEDLISGNIWLKFRKSPMEMPSYELKRAISEDFEYFGYGNQEPPKQVSLIDGSWGSFYIKVENLTLNEIMTLLLELPEQVAERLQERKIKGYKDLGLDTYGQSLDLEISQSSNPNEENDEYAKGGGVSGLNDLIRG